MLTGSALQASKAAVAAALEDQSVSSSAPEPEDLEDGEIQEIQVSMESQAESIRTVFSDPTNFNVKVCSLLQKVQVFVLSTAVLASSLLSLDSLV